MNIVLIGCGTIGRTILEELTKEGHTLTIIDEDKNKVSKMIEKYDVSGVTGNGASLDILQAAGVKDADLLICESTYLKGQTKTSDNHLYAFEAGKIARDANAKKLLLTHFWPEIDRDLYVNEAKEFFGNTEASIEGKKLILRR